MANSGRKLIQRASATLILTAILVCNVSAQEAINNGSFGKKSFKEGMFVTGSLGYNSYFGDLTEEPGSNLLPFGSQAQPGFALGIYKEFFGFLELGVKGMAGKLKEVNKEKFSSTNNTYTFTSNVFNIGLQSNINIVNLIKKDSENKFAVLVGFGYGITAYDPETSVEFPNGTEGEFPNNVASKDPGSSTTGTYSYGLGFRYKINEKWSVGLETTLYSPKVDDLDGWISAGSDDDKYTYIAANVSYTLPSKNRSVTRGSAPSLSPIADKTPVVEEKETEEVEEKVTVPAKDPVVEVKDPIVKKEVEVEDPQVEKKQATAPKLTVEDFKEDIIKFELNASKESAALNKQVKSIADKLEKSPATKITLGGYTDKSGSTAFNKTLSIQRAKWVKDQLVSKYGISNNRISIIGHGDTGTTKQYDPNNRKVEVTKVK